MTERRHIDEEVAITGRLASMSREEAVRRIVAAGGRYVDALTDETTLLVVGQLAPPLGRDGRPSRKVSHAQRLAAAGRPLRVVPEQELLGRLGLHDLQADLHRLYTSSELARILSVPTARVRGWVRDGLIRPVRSVRKLHFFDFPQVATARALVQLTAAGATPSRLRRSLELLREWMPDVDRALAQLELLTSGGKVAVRLPDGRLAEPSGQLRLDFVNGDTTEGPAADGVPATVVNLVPPPEPDVSISDERRSRGARAEVWFERGLAAEEADRPEEALAAYERARALGGLHADLAFNLGNVHYTLGRKAEAARLFANATRLDLEFVEAWNNLGNVLGELGRVDESVAAFHHALALTPDYADAHFNLAETLAAAGRLDEARRHWLTYLGHDPHSRWAELVRARLDGLGDSSA